MRVPQAYEVVVAGGGPSGASAALCLARAGHRVLLVDSANPAAFKIGEALPPAARPLLHDLGIWEAMVEDSHLPCYGNLSAWGSSHLQCTDFILDPNGHGWHLDRPRFDQLLRRMARASGADVREGTTIRRQEREERGAWRLELEGGTGRVQVRCDWLVDATGQRAAIARRQGARRLAKDSLVSLFARLCPIAHRSKEDRDARTLIEAVPDGWWYTALVPSGERVVAYLTDADLVPRRVLRTPGGFLALLDQTQHVRACLAEYGYAVQTAPRGAPARSVRLDPPAGDGWVAVGDAALSFDPLSSQGILTGLYTGLAAGQALHAHLCADPGALGSYIARLTAIDAAYQRNRLTFYGLEQRWPDRPFWRRRQ